MNKNEITKAQGKATTKTIHGELAALVLDTTTLYYERSSWGKATRYFKSTQTACKQDRLGCMTNGWLVMHVSTFGYSVDIKERVAKAEAFIKNFTGTLADILNEDGTVNRDVVPSDVIVSLFNNRNLFAREAEVEPVVETVTETVTEVVTEVVTEAPAKRMGKAQARVLSFLVAHKGESFTVSQIVKALAEAGITTYYNATNTALKALALASDSGVVEVGNRKYTFEG